MPTTILIIISNLQVMICDLIVVQIHMMTFSFLIQCIYLPTVIAFWYPNQNFETISLLTTLMINSSRCILYDQFKCVEALLREYVINRFLKCDCNENLSNDLSATMNQ